LTIDNQTDEEYGLPNVSLKPLSKGSAMQPPSKKTEPVVIKKATAPVLADEKSFNFPWTIVLLVILLLVAAFAIKVFILDRNNNSSDQQQSTVIINQEAGIADLEEEVEEVWEATDSLVSGDEEAEMKESIPEVQAPLATEAKIEVIENPTQRYYVIIASVPNLETAMEIGNNYIKQNVNISILKPRADRQENFRLSSANFSSLEEATAALNNLKSTFGESIWVLKY
jgi:hypothetical protein